MAPREPEPEPEVVQIGPHRILCGQDMYFAQFFGDLTAMHMPRLNQIGNDYLRRNGYILILVDATHSTTMTPEARRMTVDNRRNNPMRSAIAIFGTSLMTRTLATLLFKALSLVGGMDANIVFVKTEDEARLWLEEQRAALLASRAAK